MASFLILLGRHCTQHIISMAGLLQPGCKACVALHSSSATCASKIASLHSDPRAKAV
jgi:hypothetical protein